MHKVIRFSVFLAVFVLQSCGKPNDDPKPDPVVADVTISHQKIAIPLPVAGQAPVTAIAETPQFTVAITSWSPAVANTFAYGTDYELKLSVTAKPGYTLKGVIKDFFKVDGATVTHDAGSGVITVKFPKTAAEVIPDVKVDIKEIHGLTPPVAGAVPVTKITDTDQFTGP